MTKKLSQTSIVTVSVAILSIALLVTSTGTAWAHTSITGFTARNNVNNTIKISIGELNEPILPDQITGLDFITTDGNTLLPINNIFKQQSSAASSNMWADSYFYPKGRTPTVVLANSPTTSATSSDLLSDYTNVIAGNKSGAYTDKKIHTPLKAVSGSAGHFTADTLMYTQTGKTLYHVYGQINYYNDSEVKINVWTDGSTKIGVGGQTLDNSLGLGHEVYHNNGTLTFGGSSFGETDKTTLYWPGSSAGINNATHPVSVPAAVGKGGDIWSFLNSVAAAINSITGGATVTPATAP